MKSLVPIEVVERKIILICGQKVMLDSDLAALYGVSTKRLNEHVCRNVKRFPADFMFQLSPEEYDSLRFAFCDLKESVFIARERQVAYKTSRKRQLSDERTNKRAATAKIL